MRSGAVVSGGRRSAQGAICRVSRPSCPSWADRSYDFRQIDAVKIFSANDDNLPAIHPDDFSKVLENAISAARPWCTYSVPNNVWLVRVIKGLLPDAWWHAFNYALVKTLWKTGVSLFRGEALPAPPKARSSSPKRK